MYSTTNGKLTYDLSDGNNGACSASSVNSPSGRVVLTAAHCVHRLGPQPSNFVYHPGYQRGDRLPSFTVRNYQPSGLGDVISVTSSNVEKVNRGPYLGPEARDLCNYVKDR
ncbi:hypothetical protein M8C13_34455 [Crossiella sp. SN42]|uniref:hypothetical protein n=1 Tax=Crossiella sp. SN42 TaxID=2944808 RepID=UPI00207D2B52|nr:hypothetical protein [Crossiella sp. SN42]MCO1580869.1 hypothetical protein [Crossiella sp. SN42]